MKEKSRENVYEQLKIDEGVEYKVYLDHLGYKTCGVGHLCVEGDPEEKLQRRSSFLILHQMHYLSC